MYICFEGKITLKKAIKYRTNLLAQIMDFRANTKPKSQEKKQEKEIFLKTCIFFFEGREKILDALWSKIFSIKSNVAGILNPDHSKLKALTPKQMLQRLPIALAQVKASNNSERQIQSDKLFILCINQTKLLKRYTIT